jgi:biotin---protein ligase
VELKDRFGISHNIRVQTLGTEDTWKTPSLLMVYTDNGGKMIFSQIHLEVDPSLYENDESKYQTLLKNDGLRHEIFSDVLNSHLELQVKQSKDEGKVQYSRGYFLGRHEVSY